MRTPVLALSLAVALSSQAAEPHRREPVDAAKTTRLASRASDSATVSLIVRFKKTGNARTMTANALEDRMTGFRRDLGAEARIERTYHRVLFGASVRVPREMRDKIAALPYVASVHEERTLQPLLYESIPHIRADKVWETKGTRGAGVVVAVIDTGIDYNHVALGGGFGKDFKVIGGWDFVDNDADPMDTYGHGTFVAGIIAGDGEGLVGVAPDATLLAFRALGNGFGNESDVIAAVERSVDPNQDGDTSDHVDIVNMSLGGQALDNDPLAEAVENATLAGVLVVVAGGNGGDYGNVPTPAIAPSAITVGASDDRDAMADFSSRGPSWNFNIKPEIVAPGVNVGSTWLNGEYREANGTSAAAPHIAGVAALVKAVHHDWTPAQIKSAIVASSVPLEENPMAAGAGRVDALNAVNAATLVSPPFVNFGQENPRTDVWSSSQTVTLRNLSSSTKTLTAKINGLRNGIVVRATPSSVTLAAGETAEVRIEVAVTNRDVPRPLEGAHTHGGLIEWTGGQTPVRVPWAFVQGAFLRIEVPDAIKECKATILSATKKQIVYDFMNTTRVFWSYEPVDIVVSQYPASVTGWITKNVFAEQVDLVANQTVVMPLAAAQHTIATETLDEKGQLLTQPEGFCIEEFVLAFANGRKVSFGQGPETRQRLSTFSDRVKVHPLHTCADIGRTTMYTALHEPFKGLPQSVTSTMQPDWLRQDVKFIGREGHMTTAVPLMRFPGPDESYYLDGGQFFLMRPTGPQLTMYYTASPSPEMDLVTIVERWGHCNDPRWHPEAECRILGPAFLYMNESEIKVEQDAFLELSPMAYRIPAGSPLVLGTTPVWPEVGFFLTRQYWGAGTAWVGALGEGRTDDTIRAVTVVRDANGTIIGDTRRGNGNIGGQQERPHGTYTIQSVNENYTVAGAAAKATVDVTVNDTSRDTWLPRFTGLRIVDANGRQAAVIGRDAGAKLLFSLTDHRMKGYYAWRVPVREEATRVEYRLSGTTDWRPLTAAIEARHYLNSYVLFGGVGTMWSADLSSVTRGFTGFVDLRIHAEDTDGNDITLRLEPAFFVGTEMRRRTARH